MKGKGKGAGGNHPGFLWVGAVGPGTSGNPFGLVKKYCDMNSGIVKYLESWNVCSDRGLMVFIASSGKWVNISETV